MASGCTCTSSHKKNHHDSELLYEKTSFSNKVLGSAFSPDLPIAFGLCSKNKQIR